MTGCGDNPAIFCDFGSSFCIGEEHTAYARPISGVTVFCTSRVIRSVSGQIILMTGCGDNPAIFINFFGSIFVSEELAAYARPISGVTVFCTSCAIRSVSGQVFVTGCIDYKRIEFVLAVIEILFANGALVVTLGSVFCASSRIFVNPITIVVIAEISVCLLTSGANRLLCASCFFATGAVFGFDVCIVVSANTGVSLAIIIRCPNFAKGVLGFIDGNRQLFFGGCNFFFGEVGIAYVAEVMRFHTCLGTSRINFCVQFAVGVPLCFDFYLGSVAATHALAGYVSIPTDFGAGGSLCLVFFEVVIGCVNGYFFCS